MKVIEPPIDEVMDYRGLALYTKFAEGTLRHKVMRCEIPYLKVGYNVRFSKKHIDAWLLEHRREPKQRKAKSGGDNEAAMIQAEERANDGN